MLSDKNKRILLQTALVAAYGLTSETPKPDKITVEEVFDDKIIYNIDGQLYEATYEMDGETPKIGDPKKVMATKIFHATETLQTAYSELIQEAGKRNALKDSQRVKAILALCQELLSSEIPDEEKATGAVKEAEDVLALLKLEEATKTEDGVAFPSQAYAYAPDLDTPTTWKLRLWQNLEDKVTRRQLGLAAAALSPGGFRGQRVQIPSADLSTVKRKIRSAYRTLGVDEEDIPRWVKETETRELLRSYVPLTEAKIDKGRATLIVIEPGFNVSTDKYYPAEMLKRDYGIFEGQKQYADHPTEEEDKARPERSIRDWVATLKDVTVDESGVVHGIAEIIEPWFMAKLAALRDKGMLSDMGVSINAIGRATKGTIDGKETLIIEELTSARSVDFVTEPGAGGIVIFYESDRNHDVDLVDVSTLRTTRPDLVKTIEDGVKAQLGKEVKKTMENEALIKEKDEQITALTTERDALKEAAEKAEKAMAKAEAQATIKEAVDKAELPDAAKDRLLERFKDAENADGIVGAIESEVAYIAKLSEAGKVKGLGSASTPTFEKDHEALVESFGRMGMNKESAEVAASGR